MFKRALKVLKVLYNQIKKTGRVGMGRGGCGVKRVLKVLYNLKNNKHGGWVRVAGLKEHLR